MSDLRALYDEIAAEHGPDEARRRLREMADGAGCVVKSDITRRLRDEGIELYREGEGSDPAPPP